MFGGFQVDGIMDASGRLAKAPDEESRNVVVVMISLIAPRNPGRALMGCGQRHGGHGGHGGHGRHASPGTGPSVSIYLQVSFAGNIYIYTGIHIYTRIDLYIIHQNSIVIIYACRIQRLLMIIANDTEIEDERYTLCM